MTSRMPPWMTPPPDEHPSSGGEWFPHIIHNQVMDDGTVLVTWSLPGLARATVRVPLSSWLEGHHQAAGRPLARLAATMPCHDHQDVERDPDGDDQLPPGHGSSASAR